MLEVDEDDLFEEVKILTPKSFNDSRGYFSEIYNFSNQNIVNILLIQYI